MYQIMLGIELLRLDLGVAIYLIREPTRQKVYS